VEGRGSSQWRPEELKMEPWWVYRPVVTVSHQLDEEQDPDPDPHKNEKLDPDPDPHYSALVFMYLELFPELYRGRGGHAVHVAGSQATPTRHYSCLNNKKKHSKGSDQ
jgi:hypothetical protein